MFGDGKTYDFAYEPYKRLPQIASPDTIGSGPIQNIRVSFPGTGYSMNSKVFFSEEDTGGFGATAKVNLLEGQELNFIETEYQRYDGVVFEWRNGKVLGHINGNHDLRTNDFIQVSGLSTTVTGLNGSKEVSSPLYQTQLVSGAFVGLVTDIQVQFIPNNISAGSSIGVGLSLQEF